MDSIQRFLSFSLFVLLLFFLSAQAQDCTDGTCEMAASVATKLRQVLKVIKPMRTSDGDGVALFRSIGGPKADHFDPYLLLDEFKSENVRKFHEQSWICDNFLGYLCFIICPHAWLTLCFATQPDDYIGGFPDHPHRGFSTVTYMLQGHMEHRDHKGNKGNLVPGSIQFMTAGRGIVHSEMPKQENGLMHGFQLWVNVRQKAALLVLQFSYTFVIH